MRQQGVLPVGGLKQDPAQPVYFDTGVLNDRMIIRLATWKQETSERRARTTLVTSKVTESIEKLR